jgi:tRNA A37 methylthiotransferase MiaB
MKISRRTKVYFESNACNRREFDEKKLMQYFKANHCSIVKKPQRSDIIVFVTCGYAMNQVEKSIEVIQHLQGYQGKLLVTGCLPGTAPLRLSREFSGVSLPVRNLDEIDSHFPEFKIQFQDLPEVPLEINKYRRKIASIKTALIDSSLKILVRRFLHSIKKLAYRIYKGTKTSEKIKSKIRAPEIANLIIARGCIGKCSYCAIRFAVGDLKSKPISDCVKEFATLLKKGFRLFLLSAEDCGSYGVDINSSLPELLNRLHKIDLDYNSKWLIQTLSPKWAIRYSQTLREYIRMGKLQSIKCDLQSGNERILKLMNRFTDLTAILTLLLDFKKENPNIKLHSQFIIGFPSETEKEFAATLSAINKVNFDEVELFHYTDMEEADSINIQGKVPDVIINNRMKNAADWLIQKGYKIYSSSHKILAIHE